MECHANVFKWCLVNVLHPLKLLWGTWKNILEQVYAGVRNFEDFFNVFESVPLAINPPIFDACCSSFEINFLFCVLDLIFYIVNDYLTSQQIVFVNSKRYSSCYEVISLRWIEMDTSHANYSIFLNLHLKWLS